MKTKQSILLVIFMIAGFISYAQEKYDFMIIELNPYLKKEIQISVNGKEFIQEKVDYGSGPEKEHNINPLLNIGKRISAKRVGSNQF